MLLILSHSLYQGAISGAKVMKINRICNTVKAMCLQNFFGGTYAVWLRSVVETFAAQIVERG